MKKYLFFVFIILYADFLFAQKQGQEKIDSLLKILYITKEDSIKITLLNDISYNYRNINADSGLKYGQLALEISKKIKSVHGLANASLYTGMNYIRKSLYYEALENFERSFEIESKSGNENAITTSLANIGNAYKAIGNYPKALECYQQALLLYTKQGDSTKQAILLGNMGLIYIDLEDYNKALAYLQKALVIHKIKDDKNDIGRVLNGIGNVYGYLNDYRKALDIYLEALKISEATGNNYLVAVCVGNIGVVYEDLEDYDPAITYNLKAIKLNTELDNQQSLAGNLRSLGSVYSKLNSSFIRKFFRSTKERDSTVLSLIKQSITIAKKINSLPLEEEGWRTLASVYEKQGKYKETVESQKQFIAIHDNILYDENKEALTRREMQFEFEKKQAQQKAEQDKKDLLTQTEIQKQKSLRNNIATAGSIIITASIVSFLFYRRKREAQVQADISAARVKTMTAQLDKHFVFGSLSSVKNLIEESPEKATELITRSSKFLRTTLNLSESTIITLKQELDATENYLQIEKINHEDKFDFKVTIEEGIPVEQVMVPPLIFQPIVENSIKYGFSGIDYKGQINIQINKAGSQLICKIADNGIGFQPKKDTDHKSFGTKLTKERLELYNKLHKQKALFTIEPLTQGVLVTLTLPLHTA